MIFIFSEHENKPFIGMFLADKPCLLVRDLDLIMNIMKTDSVHFDRRILEIPRNTDLIGSKRFVYFKLFHY